MGIFFSCGGFLLKENIWDSWKVGSSMRLQKIGQWWAHCGHWYSIQCLYLKFHAFLKYYKCSWHFAYLSCASDENEFTIITFRHIFCKNYIHFLICSFRKCSLFLNFKVTEAFLKIQVYWNGIPCQLVNGWNQSFWTCAERNYRPFFLSHWQLT